MDDNKEIMDDIEEIEEINEENETIIDIEEKDIEVVEENIEEKTRVKKYIEKPESRKDKKIKDKLHKDYEKQYNKKQFHNREKKVIILKLIIGIAITVGIVVLFKYYLDFSIANTLEKFKFYSLGVSGFLFLLAIYLIFTDKSFNNSKPDPITDFFIINRGKFSIKTKRNLENKINVRFIMITLLKLFSKEHLAIIDEEIVLTGLDTEIDEDESVVVEFLINNEIGNLDDFLNIIEEENPVKYVGIKSKIEKFYNHYKAAIISMADDKQYINNSINKAKFILRSGGLIFFVITVMLLSKGEGTLISLLIYGLQSVGLFVLANIINGRSKGAHIRIKEIRKNKKSLLSIDEDIYSGFIYNYIFAREEKALKKINKIYKNNEIEKDKYEKFSETYNSFNYILDDMKIRR